MTDPSGVQPHDAVIVELDPTEAAQGAERTVERAGRSAVIRVPPGLPHGTLVRLPGTDPSDPGAVTEVLVRILVRPVEPSPAAGAFEAGVAATGAASATGPAGVAVPAGGPGPVAPSGYPAYPSYPAYGPPPVGDPALPPIKPRRRWLVASLVSAMVLVVLAAGGAVAAILVSRNGGNLAAEASTPSPTAPAPLSTLDYQQLLTATDTELGTGFAALRGARNPAAVHDATNALSLSAQIAADKLDDVTPPENVQSVHSRLVSDLSDLGNALSETAADANVQDVCTASAALADLTAAEATAALRSDIEELAAASYTFGSFLPEPVKPTNRRAANGYVKRISNRGLGQMRITNSGSMDAVLSLVPRSGSKAVGTVYIRGKGRFTMTGVRDGTYHVYVASGVDWDAKLKTFTRTCDFRKFDDTLKFSTTSSQYTVWNITLQTSSGGNTSASEVDPGAFPTG